MELKKGCAWKPVAEGVQSSKFNVRLPTQNSELGAAKIILETEKSLMTTITHQP
jgi:hypothetical protein